MEQLIKRDGIVCPGCGVYIPFREKAAAALNHALVKDHDHISMLCPSSVGARTFMCVRVRMVVARVE